MIPRYEGVGLVQSAEGLKEQKKGFLKKKAPSPGLHHRNSTQVSSTQSQDLNISCYLNLQLQSCPTDFKLNSLSNNSMSQFLKISPSINQLTSVSLSVHTHTHTHTHTIPIDSLENPDYYTFIQNFKC